MAGELVVGRQRHQEGLAEEVVAFEVLELASRKGGVLKVDGEMEGSRANAVGQLVGGAFVHGDPSARVLRADLRHGRRHQAGERCGERADPQERALVVRDLGELEGGEVEARRDGVGVLEQQGAGACGSQAARAAVEQSGPDLLLECCDLVRDRGLRERELMRRAGERALAGHHAEGQNASGVHRQKL